MHTGTGGTAAYWGGYDQRVMDRLGDHSARYVDDALGGLSNTANAAGRGLIPLTDIARNGSPGGLSGALTKVLTTSNVSAKVRMEAGKMQGWHDAAAILANLSDGETVKLVTHSMGTAYARGYAQGLRDYARTFDLQNKLKIEYELDVNSFQGKSLPALKSDIVGRTQYKLGGLDGGKSLSQMMNGNSVPTVDAPPNAENATADEDADKGHAIDQMSDTKIPPVGNAGTSTQKPIEQGSNNGN